jgi:predicted nucleic acid-binding protein
LHLDSDAAQHRYGLLTNDALLIAAARRLGVDGIASADIVVRSVAEVRCYAPEDPA